MHGYDGTSGEDDRNGNSDRLGKGRSSYLSNGGHSFMSNGRRSSLSRGDRDSSMAAARGSSRHSALWEHITSTDKPSDEFKTRVAGHHQPREKLMGQVGVLEPRHGEDIHHRPAVGLVGPKDWKPPRIKDRTSEDIHSHHSPAPATPQLPPQEYDELRRHSSRPTRHPTQYVTTTKKKHHNGGKSSKRESKKIQRKKPILVDAFQKTRQQVEDIS